MDQNFLKFKKRIWALIAVKCVLAGLAAGLFATVAVMLPCHLCKIGLYWYVYLGIAILGFVIGGGVAFLLLKTNDRKIAKLLDAELGLEERTQTAFEFAGQDNAMLELQRANATLTLGKIPVKALPFKNIIATVLCAAVAASGTVAIPVIAVCLPVVPIGAEQPDGDGNKKDPPRIVTDWEWGALDELINYVKASKKADSSTRTAMVGELEGLKNVLLDGVSQSSLPMFVENTVTNIRNSVKDINEALSSEEQVKANTEEQNYVINKLYEIFSLQQPGSSQEPDPEEPDPDNPDAPDLPDPDDPNQGGLIVDKTPFFDPETGETSFGEVMDEYYRKALQAFNEGKISREEWEAIMVKYFNSFNGNDNN